MQRCRRFELEGESRRKNEAQALGRATARPRKAPAQEESMS
jgi:hypothetical protein